MQVLFNTLVAIVPLHHKTSILALQSRYTDTVKRVRLAVLLPLLKTQEVNHG